MPEPIVFDIDPAGVVRYVFSDEARRLATGLGRPTILRASHVEFDNRAQAWFADMSPVGSDVRLGPHETREAALAEEHAWLLEHLPTLLCEDCRADQDHHGRAGGHHPADLDRPG